MFCIPGNDGSVAPSRVSVKTVDISGCFTEFVASATGCSFASHALSKSGTNNWLLLPVAGDEFPLLLPVTHKFNGEATLSSLEPGDGRISVALSN